MAQIEDFSSITAKNLRRIIEDNGLTQAEFADKVGYEERTVRKWLSNGIDKLSTLAVIAKAFDIRIEDILVR